MYFYFFKLTCASIFPSSVTTQCVNPFIWGKSCNANKISKNIHFLDEIDFETFFAMFVFLILHFQLCWFTFHSTEFFPCCFHRDQLSDKLIINHRCVTHFDYDIYNMFHSKLNKDIDWYKNTHPFLQRQKNWITRSL